MRYIPVKDFDKTLGEEDMGLHLLWDIGKEDIFYREADRLRKNSPCQQTGKKVKFKDGIGKLVWFIKK